MPSRCPSSLIPDFAPLWPARRAPKRAPPQMPAPLLRNLASTAWGGPADGSRPARGGPRSLTYAPWNGARPAARESWTTSTPPMGNLRLKPKLPVKNWVLFCRITFTTNYFICWDNRSLVIIPSGSDNQKVLYLHSRERLQNSHNILCFRWYKIILLHFHSQNVCYRYYWPCSVLLTYLPTDKLTSKKIKII